MQDDSTPTHDSSGTPAALPFVNSVLPLPAAADSMGVVYGGMQHALDRVNRVNGEHSAAHSDVVDARLVPAAPSLPSTLSKADDAGVDTLMEYVPAQPSTSALPPTLVEVKHSPASDSFDHSPSRLLNLSTLSPPSAHAAPSPSASRALSPLDVKPSPPNHPSIVASSPYAARAVRETSTMDRKPSLTPSAAYSDSPMSERSPSGSGASTPMDSKPSTLTTPGRRGRKAVKKEPIEIQLIAELPIAEEEALRTFTELDECTYYSKALGNAPYYDDLDATRCDCSWDHDVDEIDQACGVDAQCMNRSMQIECSEGDCKCGRRCQNQRFQKRDYAPIDVVKTEKKGFGVRVREDLVADTFVYEYVGEVIGPAPFARRMKEYAQEGIRHFYFMALDREIYIDATKKGGKGRFLNHSCNPNCVVAKWTIGKKMRMGIFTKRDVKKDEELTFNYNVDRYGHDAQECFCGAPNCVGWIGGKTQTDIGMMDDLYLDALGITEEVEALALRGTKKKKGKKLDVDFTPDLKPIIPDEVPKVAAAVRQAIQTPRILEKLLSRIQMTADEEVQRQLLRLHGFNLMSHILKEYPTNLPIITLDLQILSVWPLMTRNKVESSGIEDSVRSFANSEDEKIKGLAANLLTVWEALELGYRIPRSSKDSGDGKRQADDSLVHLAKRTRRDSSPADDAYSASRPAFVKPEASTVVRSSTPVVPSGWLVHQDPTSGKSYFENSFTRVVQWNFPTAPVVAEVPRAVVMDVNAIIAAAQATADALLAKEKAAKALEEENRPSDGRGRDKSKSSATSKEKKVLTLFSAIVVGVMSKYKSQLDSDQFKKRAKEVTSLLCEKEKKHPLYLTEAYDSLTPEKASKIKGFTKDWVKKLIERKGPKLSSSSSSSSISTSTSKSTSASTPNGSTSGSHLSQSSPATPSKLSSDMDDAALVYQMIAEASGGSSGTPKRNGGGTPPRRSHD